MKVRNEKIWMRSLVLSLTASVFFAAAFAHASVGEIGQSYLVQQETPAQVVPLTQYIPRKTLLVVDENVNDYQVLIEEFNALNRTQSIDVLNVHPGQNGLRQMSRWFASTQTTYDSVHVISHATPGVLTLGSMSVSADNIRDYSQDFGEWRSALKSDADILFYGCDLTANPQGATLVERFHELTGANIAASSNRTGSISGADWNLETIVGQVDTGSLKSEAWGGVLTDLVIRPVGYPVRESDGMVSGEPDGSGLSLPFAQGDSAVWTNAGTAGDEEIDIRATVVTFTDNSGDSSGAISFSTQGDDLWVQINKGDATILWEVFQTGGGQSVTATGNPIFTIADIDGDGSASAFPALQIEAVSPEISSLTSYTLDTPTNLEAGVVGGDLYVRGTQSESGGSTSLVAFRWNNVTSWSIGYETSSTAGARYFIHDGDGDLDFNSPNTTTFLSLDLDANDSTVTGNNFLASVFAQLGAAVSVTDVDPDIVATAPLNSTLDSAAVSISNSYPGDELLVNGSAAASGTIAAGATTFNYTNSAVSGNPVVAISGSGTLSEYEMALQAITYQNTSANVYFAPRLVTVTVTDDEQTTTSNIAVGIVPVNPDTDGDSYLNDVDLDDDNDGILDTAETPSDPMADADSDGYPAYLDDDDSDALIGDDDGDTQEAFDSDRDGIPNHLDLDSDNDGIPDNIEAQSSAAYLPPNNAYDGFGVDTAYAGGIDRLIDIDGDMVDDTLDTDSDNDGISDTTEAGLSLGLITVGVNGFDDDVEAGDDYTDINGTFDSTPINDLPDVDNSGGEPDWRDPQDFDGDSFAQNVDIDDDNDGITDATETGVIDSTNFDNGDLSFSGEWRDNSFFQSGYLGVTAIEGEDYLFASNSDVGVGDTFGTASGLLDTTGWLQGSTTFSLDVSYPDLGADSFATFTITLYSGVSEIGQLTGPPPVLDGSSVYTLSTYLSQAQIAAGISIEIIAPLTGQNALVVLDNLQVVGSLDFDGDGVPDHTDLDSDNDGLPDNVEAQLTATYQAPANNDADSDGLDDNYEFSGDEGLTPVSTSTLTQVDYLDLDSDGDSISDSYEAGLFLGVSNVGVNGWDDSVEPGDDYTDVNGAFDVPATDLPDFNGDALSGGDVNYRDNDSDGDGVLDVQEDSSTSAPAPVGDTNSNDIDDSIDAAITSGADVNGNGIDDAFEPTDTDKDGVPNYQDLDSDNDGIRDNLETNADTDLDLISNFLDLDSDNDGIPDNVEAQATSAYVSPNQDEVNPSGYEVDGTGVNTAYGGGLTPVNTDGSDSDDYIDLDSDNDGQSDNDESGLELNTLDTGVNGLDNDVENADNYLDVNGTVVQGLQQPADLPTQAGSSDVDFRALPVPVVATTNSATNFPTIVGTHDSDTLLAVTVNLITYTEGDGNLNDNADDTWSLVIPDSIADGTYNVVAIATLGPLTASDTSVDELIIDTELPVITAEDVGPTNNQRPSLSGTTLEDPGATVTVTDQLSATVCTATVVLSDPNAWSCSPGSDLSEGTTTLTASISDSGGNTASASFDVEVDITAFTVTGFDAGPTDDRTPDFFGTTNAPAGTVVLVTTSIGGTVCAATTTADIEENSWTCTTGSELPDGVTTLTAKVTDEAGNVGSDTFNVTINALSATILINPVATDDVIDGLEDDAGVVVSGSTQNANTEEVTVTVNDVSYVTTTSAVDGSWSVTLPAVDVQAFDAAETVVALLSNLPSASADDDSREITRDGDVDNDGIPDQIEAGADSQSPVDTDGDGIADYLDTDSDNDGIPDSVEDRVAFGTDSDGDGLDDAYDVDSIDGTDLNGDGITDSFALTDSDSDGTADYIDRDSDEDGIPDVLEAGADALDPVDSDSDGRADYRDTDSDNDSILDRFETVNQTTLAGVDTNSNGVDDSIDATFTDGADGNGNGIDDAFEPGDTDRDGTSDYLDLDSDADGIPDILEGAIDTDGDGIADFRDIDSDGDGILDAEERGSDVAASGSDADGDGVDDAFDADLVGEDANNNGVDDAAEPVDTDGDGIADVRDIDSDGDGIVDNIEGQSTSGYTLPLDRDQDMDGLDDAYDANTSALTTDSDSSEGLAPFDTNSNGTPDYVNSDADGDGVSDTVEAYGDVDAALVDTDEDGLDDAYDAYNNLTVPDLIANVTNDAQRSGDFIDSDGDAGNANGESDWRDGIDTDGDGIPDLSGDLDDDNDGILDTVELAFTQDLDGDGVPNHLDLDSDNDGISDNVEAQSRANYVAPETDANGNQTVDSNGVNTAYAGGLTPVDTDGSTTDGDGTQSLPDFLDADSDGDGLQDTLEVGSDPLNPSDSDNDGTPDYIDTDADNDGIPDSVENAGTPALTGVDTDSDGIDDALDVDQTGGTDANGDGIDDSAFADRDSDGISNYLDLDSDNDGVNDVLEIGDNPFMPKDSDGDGQPDYLDTDSDNDGIPDALENRFGPRLGGIDSDSDGLDDVIDVDATGGTDNDGNGVDDMFELLDSDGDGRPDFIDPDSDNDGIPDSVEASNVPAETGMDSDGDGIDDAFDIQISGGADINADGIDDLAQPVDTNMDGLPDYLVTDSDTDGIPDSIEADVILIDSNGNGIYDSFDVVFTGGVDANGDGVDDNVTATDTDGDLIPDYLDIDSDNDGISDVREAGLPDANGDGIVDAGQQTTDPLNTDGVDLPDYRDLDSDNDGLFDLYGAGFAIFDLNGDGVLDSVGDTDGDGVMDSVDGQPGSFSAGRDFDGDGVLDFLDLDSDNDSIPNAIEAPGGNFGQDSDGDGIPDYLDLDSDNDGVSDLIESDSKLADVNGDGQIDSLIDENSDGLHDTIDLQFTPDDADGDGLFGFQDLDNDGDGISDLVESGVPEELDANNDGMIDTVAMGDADFDGMLDVVDPSVNGGIPGVAVTPVDTDGDGAPDYKDLDSDGDSVMDQSESGDGNNDGIPDRLQAPTAVSAPTLLPSANAGGGSGSIGLGIVLLMLSVAVRRKYAVRCQAKHVELRREDKIR